MRNKSIKKKEIVTNIINTSNHNNEFLISLKRPEQYIKHIQEKNIYVHLQSWKKPHEYNKRVPFCDPQMTLRPF